MVNYSTGKGCYFSVHAVVPTYNRSNDAISFVPAVTLIHYILSVFLLWWIHCSGLQVQFIVLFSFSTMYVPLRVCCLLYLRDFLPVNAVKHSSCVFKDLNHPSLTEAFPMLIWDTTAYSVMHAFILQISFPHTALYFRTLADLSTSCLSKLLFSPDGQFQ